MRWRCSDRVALPSLFQFSYDRVGAVWSGVETLGIVRMPGELVPGALFVKPETAALFKPRIRSVSVDGTCGLEVLPTLTIRSRMLRRASRSSLVKTRGVGFPATGIRLAGVGVMRGCPAMILPSA
jgi:hypothetical protein